MSTLDQNPYQSPQQPYKLVTEREYLIEAIQDDYEKTDRRANVALLIGSFGACFVIFAGTMVTFVWSVKYGMLINIGGVLMGWIAKAYEATCLRRNIRTRECIFFAPREQAVDAEVDTKVYHPAALAAPS